MKGLHLPQEVESYSGFITVDEKHNSNLFFWFFPAENGNKSAPLVLWLQGKDIYMRGQYFPTFLVNKMRRLIHLDKSLKAVTVYSRRKSSFLAYGLKFTKQCISFWNINAKYQVHKKTPVKELGWLLLNRRFYAAPDKGV